MGARLIEATAPRDKKQSAFAVSRITCQCYEFVCNRRIRTARQRDGETLADSAALLQSIGRCQPLPCDSSPGYRQSTCDSLTNGNREGLIERFEQDGNRAIVLPSGIHQIPHGVDDDPFIRQSLKQRRFSKSVVKLISSNSFILSLTALDIGWVPCQRGKQLGCRHRSSFRHRPGMKRRLILPARAEDLYQTVKRAVRRMASHLSADTCTRTMTATSTNDLRKSRVPSISCSAAFGAK